MWTTTIIYWPCCSPSKFSFTQIRNSPRNIRPSLLELCASEIETILSETFTSFKLIHLLHTLTPFKSLQRQIHTYRVKQAISDPPAAIFLPIRPPEVFPVEDSFPCSVLPMCSQENSFPVEIRSQPLTECVPELNSPHCPPKLPTLSFPHTTPHLFNCFLNIIF